MATISKTFDPSKFTKSITKSVKNISTGFNDPDTWISTGNYAFNKKISGDFFKGIPLGKIAMFAGESGCLPKDAQVTMVDGNNKLQITIEELGKLFENTGSACIDTPDGPQKVSEWFNKGKLKIYEITTKNHTTRCAFNHLIQLDTDIWVLAKDVKKGFKVKTTSGDEEVLSVVNTKKKEYCYDFTIEHPNHRYWGDGFSSHNSGKSFLTSGSIVKHAQKQGIFTVLIDTENALDEEWLQAIGVDTDPEKILRISAAMVDDVAKIISEFVDGYKAEYMDAPKEERPKILFVVDSLGMLLTPTDVNQFESGDMKGDMGRKTKALKALVTNCSNMIGNLNIGMVFTNHTYANQDIYTDEKQIISGGCLAAGENIIMEDGSLKEIQQIKVGDRVKTLSGSSPVASTWNYENENTFKILFEDSTSVICTPYHKFTVNNEWTKAQHINIGDELKNVSGSTIKVIDKYVCNDRDVFDIEVHDDEHYILENGVVSHNSGVIFAASIVVTLQKRKLKEDEDGNKVKEVNGIRAAIQVAKTRFTKPFEKIEIKIPYSTGLDPYSGLLELFEAEGIVVKEGNKLKYIAQDGTEYKEFRKKFGPDILDVIMMEYDEVKEGKKNDHDSTEEDNEGEELND